MRATDPGEFGQVNLLPAALHSQLSQTLSQSDTNILWHSPSMGLILVLHVVHAQHQEQKGKDLDD